MVDAAVTMDSHTVSTTMRLSTGGSAIIEIIDNDDPVVTVSYGKEKYEIPEGADARLLSVTFEYSPSAPRWRFRWWRCPAMVRQRQTIQAVA